MNESKTLVLVIAFAIVIVLFLLFGAGMMGGGMISGGMMGNGGMGEMRWMWIPTLLVFSLGVVLAWAIFGKKK